MKRTSLGEVKQRSKRLKTYEFKNAKRNGLPAPLHKLSGSRRHVTGMLPVADDLVVCFVWRDGSIPEKTAMYGYLFQETQGQFTPLIRMDWHPSHKGLHVRVNCENDKDLTGRDLVGCKELNLSDSHTFDVRKTDDRARFVDVFCRTCNIALGDGELL